MKGHMINPTLETNLQAALRNAIRSVLDNAEDFDVSQVRELIEQTERRLNDLANSVSQYAADASAAIYELENIDTSEVVYELRELAKLFPESNPDNS
jgi:hypothetical protein